MNSVSISIIVPVRNEEDYIEECLESVLNFEGLDSLEYEILIIDGNSTDNTREKIQLIAKRNPEANIKILDNPDIFQANALNVGIKEAKSDYILRLDAHSIYPKKYLIMLIETALRTNAANTGGILITRPYNESYQAHLVQALTTHKFGVGNSGFRTDMSEGVADTVPFGFFKKQIFNEIGYFDERLIRAQDYEFNQRIRKAGKIVWLNPNIKTEYFNQPDIFKFLKKQLFNEGPYNAYMWYLHPYTLTYRHFIPAVFVLGIFFGSVLSVHFNFIHYVFASVLILYFLLAFYASIQQAIKYKRFRHVITLPLSFFMFHFSYGLGILTGLFNLLFNISPVQKGE
jgi:glycosyltransferase involved in cell wall biosynthesis